VRTLIGILVAGVALIPPAGHASPSAGDFHHGIIVAAHIEDFLNGLNHGTVSANGGKLRWTSRALCAYKPGVQIECHQSARVLRNVPGGYIGGLKVETDYRYRTRQRAAVYQEYDSNSGRLLDSVNEVVAPQRYGLRSF